MGMDKEARDAWHFGGYNTAAVPWDEFTETVICNGVPIKIRPTDRAKFLASQPKDENNAEHIEPIIIRRRSLG